MRPASRTECREELLDARNREQLKLALPPLLQKWETLMNVKASKVLVQRMKTKWGRCNPDSHATRLNTDLTKTPPECLEYIIAHELAHLIEPSHNARFALVINLFMPKWKYFREELKDLPVRHEKLDFQMEFKKLPEDKPKFV